MRLRASSGGARPVEHWHRALFDGFVDGVAIVIDGTVQYVNAALTAMTGYAQDEITGRHPEDFVLPEERERARDRVRALLSGAVASPSEYHLLRKDGTTVPVEIASLVVDLDGQPALVSFLRDVSSRKQAEEAIRESEERYRAIVQAAPIPIAITRLSDGLVLHANRHMGPMLGLPEGETVGTRSLQFYRNPADRVALLEALEREGFVRNYELQLKKSDGTPFWALLSVQKTILHGEPVLITGFYDITQRRQVEEALRQSEERYRTLYEDNPAMYFTVDAQGIVLSVNAFGAQQLGYTPDELLGRPVLSVFFESDREAVAGQLEAWLTNPDRLAEWEFRKVRKDGSILWVKEVARAVRGPSGDMIVLIVCEDITERKRAEEALEEAREELETRVERQMEKGPAHGLSFREMTVLNLIAAGKSDKEIATLLGITLRTASKHVTNILGKMHAASRTEAGVRAVREGLLD